MLEKLANDLVFEAEGVGVALRDDHQVDVLASREVIRFVNSEVLGVILCSISICAISNLKTYPIKLTRINKDPT